MILVEFLGGLFAFIVLFIIVISIADSGNRRVRQEEELRRVGRIFRGEDESKTLNNDDVEKIARLFKDV